MYIEEELKMSWILSMGMITAGLFGLSKPQLVYKENENLSRIVRLVSALTLICAMLIALSDIMLRIG